MNSQNNNKRNALLPQPVNIASILLGLVAISHAVIPIIIGVNPGRAAGNTKKAHPEFDTKTVIKSVNIAFQSALIFHLILLLLCLFLIIMLRKQQPWVRRLTAISQALSIFFSWVSWTSSTMFHVVIPVIDIIQITIIILLYIPQTSKAYFSKNEMA